MTGCTIQFQNNPLKIYYGGQTLMGRAILTVHDGMNVRGVFVRIEGKAYCRWSTGSGKNRKTHVGEELYFTETTNLIGNREDEFELKPDTYEFTFQCTLPQLLPTSLEGTYGHIRYTVKIVLDRPFWPDKTFTEVFTVLKTLNLNLDPLHSRPQSLIDRKKYNLLCCLCCCIKSGELSVVGQIPQSGYAPGQYIYISAKVSNKSNSDVECHAKIIKIISYFASGHKRIEEIVIVDKILGTCPEGGVQDFNGDLGVPAIPPTDENTSHICKVRYELRIIGKTDVCCQYDLKLNMPIVFGTYPIIQQQGPLSHDNKVSAPYPPDVHVPPPSAPFDGTGATAPYQTDSDLPSYEQAVGGASKIEDGTDYTPHYLVYRTTSFPHGSNN